MGEGGIHQLQIDIGSSEFWYVLQDNIYLVVQQHVIRYLLFQPTHNTIRYPYPDYIQIDTSGPSSRQLYNTFRDGEPRSIRTAEKGARFITW